MILIARVGTDHPAYFIPEYIFNIKLCTILLNSHCIINFRCIPRVLLCIPGFLLASEKVHSQVMFLFVGPELRTISAGFPIVCVVAPIVL